ncbi:MAG: DNA-binding protein [Magnetococcus sp. THC-1_WYH]
MKKLTQEEVNSACEEMTAQGKHINTVSLRVQLGNRGGYTTIGNMYSNWQKAKEKEEIPPIPQDVEKAALKLAEEIWKFAWKIHADDIKSMRAFHRDEIETKNDEIKHLLEGMDEAESKIFLDIEKINELKTTITELQQQLAKTTGAMEVYKIELAEIKQKEKKPNTNETKIKVPKLNPVMTPKPCELTSPLPNVS